MDDAELLRRLRAADPGGGEELSHWADSEAGRRAFERILAQTAEPATRPARERRFVHIVLVAGAAVVVLGAAAGGLAYGLADRAHVAVSTTAASSSADRVDVLALVVAAADAKFATGGQHEQPGVTSDPVATVHRAVSLGVIGAADSDWAATHGSLTRATYALWIWRALGDRLESVRQATFSDLGGLSEEVRRAVMAVAGAGILEGTEDGRFEPDRVLTQKEVDESIRRLEHMLGLSAE